MKKLLSASRPLGVINPSADGWFRANSITIVTYSYTTNRRMPKIKQSLATLNLSPIGESRLISTPRLSRNTHKVDCGSSKLDNEDGVGVRP